MKAPFADFYRRRRVLVTGHTGFKGGWLSLWLHGLGAEVSGFSLPAPAGPSLYETLPLETFAREFFQDVREPAALRAALEEAAPEVVFHLAAQPLVRRSYADPAETFETNVLGTMHLLEAVRRLRQPCAVVVVTSDKCYENRRWEHGYRETDPLGGHDVYSMSKAAAELLVASWRQSFFRPEAALGPLATARAGNVIGGGDYAADRLLPDCVRAVQSGRPLGLRHPAATRPWQHVLDCLSGYLCLAARLTRTSGLDAAFNFGPAVRSNRSVAALAGEFFRHWPGEWRDHSDPGAPHEAELLHLSTDLAAARLGWFPVWDFEETVRETVLWYRARHEGTGDDPHRLSLAQIERFTEAAARRQIAWACS